MRVPTTFYPMVGPIKLKKKQKIDLENGSSRSHQHQQQQLTDEKQNEDVSPAGELAIPVHYDGAGSGESRSTTMESDATFEAEDADKEQDRAEKHSGHPTRAPMALTTNVPVEDSQDPFLVTIAGKEEELSPHHWNVTYRWILTVYSGVIAFNASFASSAPSDIISVILEHFHETREEVGVLQIGIFVAGYVLGPIVWGPLSERYGRRMIFIVSYLPSTLLLVGCALAPNIAALSILRFLSGAFAASALTNSGALISDLWGPDQRGNAMAIFTLAPFAGPALGPSISGFMNVSGIDWRWIFWLLCIFSGACWVLIVIFVPETYVPYILCHEAKRMRRDTGDDRWHAALESSEETVGEILKRTVLKPFIMLFEEPMLFLLSLYMAFLYGLLYLLFEAIPLIFQGRHKLNPGVGGLPFISLALGGASGAIFYVVFFNRRYKALHAKLAPKPVPPEARLEPMMLAGPLLVVVFFWLGWGSNTNVSVWSPIIAIFFFGPSIGLIFLSSTNYTVDAYLKNAASALAVATVLRSTFGAGFPMFASQMYAKLGIGPASSLIGGIACLFVPIPFLLKKFGKRIRMMSKNAVVLEE